MNIPDNTINIIESKIRQASAVAKLLINDGQDIDGFESSHHLIVSSIGIISELLDSAYAELMGK